MLCDAIQRFFGGDTAKFQYIAYKLRGRVIILEIANLDQHEASRFGVGHDMNGVCMHEQ
jgi:hypothetical protein